MDELLDRDEVVSAVNFWSAIVHRQCSTDDNLLSYGKGALCLFCPFLVVEIEAAEYLDHLLPVTAFPSSEIEYVALPYEPVSTLPTSQMIPVV